MADPHHYDVPPSGSLGLLALGYRGIQAWRDARGTDWIEDRRQFFSDPSTPADVSESETEPEVDENLIGLKIAVVSGLPRSGTSMAMQMLAAGGLPPFTDGERVADSSNPEGYLEHERVKSLARDDSWVSAADSHAIKVVSPLLPHLPPGPTYRVIMMTRPLDDVLASQATMLSRFGHEAAAADVLRHAYVRAQKNAWQWIRTTPDVSGLAVPYSATVQDPQESAMRIASFMSGHIADSLCADSMASVVDPSLRHHSSNDA